MLRNTSSLPGITDAPASFDSVSPPIPRHRAWRCPTASLQAGSPRQCTAYGQRRPSYPARVAIAPSEAVERQSMSGHGITVELVQATARNRFEFRYGGASHLLVAYEHGVRHASEALVDGAPPSPLRDLARKLTFVPAGCDYREWHQLHASGRIMYVYLDPAALSIQGGSGACGSLGARQLFEDATLRSTLEKLRSLIESAVAPPRPESRPESLPESLAYLDALGAVLMHELVRLNGAAANGGVPARGGLAAWQQRLVAAYIDEHLPEHIPLATLAHLARLSPYHFSRAFKQSFGAPPHRYHTHRRIERAKALLERRALSVTEIGLRLGFSETSAFTAAFRKTTGLTPSRYHRSIVHLPTPGTAYEGSTPPPA